MACQIKLLGGEWLDYPDNRSRSPLEASLRLFLRIPSLKILSLLFPLISFGLCNANHQNFCFFQSKNSKVPRTGHKWRAIMTNVRLIAWPFKNFTIYFPIFRRSTVGKQREASRRLVSLNFLPKEADLQFSGSAKLLRQNTFNLSA